MTPGFALAARWVIHTVGPLWSGGTHGESELLRSCYHSTLRLARDHDLRSLAFPSISTGAYGYPIDQAARIAVRSVRDGLHEPSSIESVVFVCFAADDLAVYEEVLAS